MSFTSSRLLDTYDDYDYVVESDEPTRFGFSTSSSVSYDEDGVPYMGHNRTGYFEVFLFQNGTTVYFNLTSARFTVMALTLGASSLIQSLIFQWGPQPLVDSQSNASTVI